MKSKGQQTQVSKLEPLALAFNFGGLAEWSIAAGLQPVNGGPTTVLGFESLTRRHLLTPPASASTPARGMKRTAEAARIRKFSIRLLAVELKRRFHSDLPQLRGRMQKSRKTAGWIAALSVCPVRQDFQR